jgi:DNA-binding NarL/FixJ family response regulator
MAMAADSRVTILFIDSHNSERIYYANQLKQLSSEYVVYHAANGKTGLAICQSFPIDFVVLEISLDDMSGFEVLAQLVTNVRYRGIGVLVLTRLTNPFLLEMAVKNSALFGLCKSFTPPDFLHKYILKAISASQKLRKPLKPEEAAPLHPFGNDLLCSRYKHPE